MKNFAEDSFPFSFSRYCLAVKVAARSRYPKDPFEFKDTTHNSRLVTEPGEGVLEPVLILITAPLSVLA